MLVHLSKTSPYVCDVSLGPIEPANRMAQLPNKKLLPYLDIKESFPKQTRTPLKLLAAEEIPLDTSLPPTASANSREQSLQPVWYSEQTIVDENLQQRMSIENENSCLLETKTSLMRKSSTFNVDRLNDSEKENDANIITSTQKQGTPPTEESFRALEHLLGLGSAVNNFTMTMTAQESPKSNHDTLSLTIVTPTELVNNTTAASLHLSYMPNAGGSLPSSQNVLLMPTIESITEPSINTTLPAPFSVDNSDVDDDSCTSSNTDNSSALETAATTEETTPILSIRPPTSADVAYRALAKRRKSGRISQPIKTTSPLVESKPVNVNVRSSLPAAPTRVLRSSTRRVSLKVAPISSFDNQRRSSKRELVEVVTLPEEEEDEEEEQEEQENPSSSGITLNLTIDKGTTSESPFSAEDADCSASSSEASPALAAPSLAPVLSCEFSYNTPTMRQSIRRLSNVQPTIEEVTEDEQTQHQTMASDRLSVSSMKSNLSVLSSNQTRISEAPAIVLQKSLAGSASPSPNGTPIMTDRPSDCLTSNLSPRRSINPLHSSTPSVRGKSLHMISIGDEEQYSTMARSQSDEDSIEEETIIMVDKEQQVSLPITVTNDEGIQTSPERRPKRTEISTQTTPIERRFHSFKCQTTPIKQSSFHCQTSPIPVVVRRSFECQTSPTPVVVKHSLPQQTSPIPIVVKHSLTQQTSPIPVVVKHSLTQQTSPIPVIVKHSLPQQTSPIPVVIKHSLPQQTSPIPVVIKHSLPQQTSPCSVIVQESLPQEPSPVKIEIQKTPIHTKHIIHNRRNVRFQFTPSTDARLAAKEKQEEEQKRVKPEIPIEHSIVVIPSEDETDDETRKMNKIKKKHPSTKKKKTEETLEEINESPILLPAPEPKLDEEITKKKRSARLEKKVSPVVEVAPPAPQAPLIPAVPSVEPAPVIQISTTTTKRVNTRKRANPKTSSSTEVSPQTTTTRNSETKTVSPSEPLLKRAKTSRTASSPNELPSTRSRAKTPSKTSSSPDNKKKGTTVKKGKRRLHSVEQDEGLNTADEEENQNNNLHIESNDEQKEKIESLTVPELKARLTAHGQTIPKGVRKADLVALLINVETQSRKDSPVSFERDQAEPQPTTRKTRRKKMFKSNEN